MSKIFPRHESTQVRDLFNLFITRFTTTICVNSSHCPLCKIKSLNHILRDRCLHYSIFKYFNKENNPLEPCLTCILVLNFSPALSQVLLLFRFKTWQVSSSCTGIESQWMEAEKNYRGYLLHSPTQSQISCVIHNRLLIFGIKELAFQ